MNEHSLPEGYSFCRTALGQFAVRGPKTDNFACIIIDKDGDIRANDVPCQVVEAAIAYWRSLPVDQQGCVPE